jgi:hypothetical protein
VKNPGGAARTGLLSFNGGLVDTAGYSRIYRPHGDERRAM